MKALCECGHPEAAHRRKWTGRMLSGGGRAMDLCCVATVTRRHPQGDDSWPCGCKGFREAKPDA